MATSLCVWIVILSACWFTDFIHSLPGDDLTPQFEYDLYEVSIPENQLGPVLGVLPAPINASTSGNHTIVYSISEVFPRMHRRNFIVNQSSGVLTVYRELDFEKTTDNITIILNASLEIDNTKTTNTSVTVSVENVNESPVFRGGYTTSIYDDARPGSFVIRVQATDPEKDTLRYLLQSSNFFFGVRSNGVVYVKSLTFLHGSREIVRVRAEDPQGLYGITSVEVRIRSTNRPPVFKQRSYTAEIFDNAPYGTPVVQVQATDPDPGDTARLWYLWWISDSRFRLDSSTGQIYVVSSRGLSGTIRLGVRVEDPERFDDTVQVEVNIKKCHTTTILLGTLIPLAVILCGVLIFVIWKTNAIRRIF